MAIDLDREYFFSDVKLVCTIFSPRVRETKLNHHFILSICFFFVVFCCFFFMNEKDTLGARSKIGYNDIGYFAIDFPTIWWIA